MSEVRGQMSEDGYQRTEAEDTPVEHPEGTRFNAARRSEVGGQRTEGRGQMSEGGVFVQPLINPRRNHTYPDPFRKKARNWVGCALKRGNLVWQNFVEILWYNHPSYGISTTEDRCWTLLCDPKRRKVNMADSPGNARHNILAPMWFGEIAGALW
jgi:hypothetical protein